MGRRGMARGPHPSGGLGWPPTHLCQRPHSLLPPPSHASGPPPVVHGQWSTQWSTYLFEGHNIDKGGQDKENGVSI